MSLLEEDEIRTHSKKKPKKKKPTNCLFILIATNGSARSVNDLKRPLLAATFEWGVRPPAGRW